jgi:hypothetical protein
MSTILRPQVAILSLRERPAWKALQQHHAKMQNLRGERMGGGDDRHATSLSRCAGGLQSIKKITS